MSTDRSPISSDDQEGRTLYHREVSDLDFLIGQTVNELRYSVPGNLRMVFDIGDWVEPALYADLGQSDFLDGKGNRHEVDAEERARAVPLAA